MEKKQAKLFLKYLAKASSRKSAQSFKTQWEVEPKHTAVMEQKISDMRDHRPEIIKKKLRLPDFNTNRRHALEKKVKTYFIDRRYQPFEDKLHELKQEFKKLKRSKKYGKRKLSSLQHKLDHCEELLEHVKKLYITGH